MERHLAYFSAVGDGAIVAVNSENGQVLFSGVPKNIYGSAFGGNNMLSRQAATRRLFQVNTQSGATGLIVVDEVTLAAEKVITFGMTNPVPWGMWVDKPNRLLFAALPNAIPAAPVAACQDFWHYYGRLEGFIMRRIRFVAAVSFVFAVICSLFVIVPAWAHHSHGNYNMTQYTNLKGEVTEVHWINPHSWIYLEVTNDKGEADVWALEGASITQLNRRGWTKESIKAGDSTSVRCHQLRDGTNACLLGFVSVAGAPEKTFD